MNTGRVASGLRMLRETAGLSQKAVAGALGITDASYSRWEAGKSPLRVSDLETLRALFGVGWGTFFDALGMTPDPEYQTAREWIADRQVERLGRLEDEIVSKMGDEMEGNTSRPFAETPREPRIADAADRRRRKESGRFPRYEPLLRVGAQ